MRKLSSINRAVVPVQRKFPKLSLDTREAISQIEAIEEEMLSQEQEEIPVNHYFGKDVYVREIFFKKGTVATGRVQKYDHVSILLSGRMTIWTPEFGMHDVVGPQVTEVKAGMKRFGYAHTDVHWICAYGVRDNEQYHQDELLDFLTFRYYGDYLDFQKQIGADKWLES